jgi:hypothetical protein
MLRGMSESRRSELVRIHQRFFDPTEDGWLWMALEQPDLDDGGVLNRFEGERLDVASTVDGLVTVLGHFDGLEVFFMVCRRRGQPHEEDRELWRGLRHHLDGSTNALVDLVVFGADSAYSMRAEDAGRDAVA